VDCTPTDPGSRQQSNVRVEKANSSKGKGSQRKCPAMGFWHHYTGGQGTHSDKIIKELMKAQQAGKPSPFPERLLKNIREFPSFTEGNYQAHAAWNDWPRKLHRIQKGDQVRIELYHLVNDPMETTDPASKEKSRVPKMREELEQWQAPVLNSWAGRDYTN